MMNSVDVTASRQAFKESQPSAYELMRQASKVLGRDLFAEVEGARRYTGLFDGVFGELFGDDQQGGSF